MTDYKYRIPQINNDVTLPESSPALTTKIRQLKLTQARASTCPTALPGEIHSDKNRYQQSSRASLGLRLHTESFCR